MIHANTNAAATANACQLPNAQADILANRANASRGWKPDQTFIDLYPFTTNADLCAHFGISRSTVERNAKILGLEKSPAHWLEQQRLRAIGKTKSPETRAKIAAKHVGKNIPTSVTEKALATKTRNNSIPKGESHYKWSGGHPWERLKDERYRPWRNAILKRDDYTCQKCGRKNDKKSKGLIAHHIKPYAEYPSLQFELSNGVTLCRSCHKQEHHPSPCNDPVPCACGCGTMIQPYDIHGRRRRFVNHHANAYEMHVLGLEPDRKRSGHLRAT